MTSPISNSTTAVESPQFKHDCSSCVFLGRHQDGKTSVDLYYHPSETLPSVIARFSSEGPDYTSGMEGSYGSNPLLTTARHRAEQRGLLKYNVRQAVHYAKAGTPEQVELQQAIPGTREYRAYRQLKIGETEQSQTLVRELLVIEREVAPYLTDDLARVEAIQTRLAAYLHALGRYKNAFAYGEAAKVTEFLYPVDSLELTEADVAEARKMALKWHAGQMWGELPYIEHLDQVVEELRKGGAEAWQLCAAYLHDIFEDTKCPDEDVLVQFGIKVFSWARSVAGNGANRKERQKDIVRRLENDETGAIWLKLVDRLINVRKTVQDKNRSLFKMYRDELPLYHDLFEFEASINPAARLAYNELRQLLSLDI